METPLVGDSRPRVIPTRRFYKMSGSGNDFVMFDVRTEPDAAWLDPYAIRAMCARATGIGADGVVLLQASVVAEFRMAYYNSDGSRAAMCGNAALCTTRLAVELGAARPEGMCFETDSGLVSSRMRGMVPEVDLPPVTEFRDDAGIPLMPGELQMGFALVGVPHLVVRCEQVETVDVVARGRPLRHHSSLAAGANVNFISATADGVWAMRTYERGVEGETLACGSGAIACGLALCRWGHSGLETRLLTRARRPVTVRLERDGPGYLPTLAGEGRLVFAGETLDLG